MGSLNRCLLIKCILISLYFFAYISYGQDIQFYGEAKPGSVIIAHGNGIVSATLNKQKLFIDSNRTFIFGFDRDAKGKFILKVKQKNKKPTLFTYQIEEQVYEKQRLSLPSKFVTPPKKVLAQIKKETLQMKKARTKMQNTKTAFFKNGFSYPVDSVEITSTFGVKRILNGKPKKDHNGIDFGGEEGDSVYSITDGIVLLAAENFYYNGTFVLIDHGQGLTSVYLHLSKLHVKTGQKVKMKELIGEIGSTGRSTGPHLHLGVQWYKKRIDPLNVLDLKF